MFLSRIEEIKSLVETSLFLHGKREISEEVFLTAFQQCLVNVKKAKGIVYCIGNGGSAAIASHFRTDLIKTLEIGAVPLTDGAIFSCIGNDCGYEEVYSYPLKRLIKEGDLLIAISSSGKSLNMIHAAKVCLEKGAQLITLSGFASDNPLKEMGHLNFWVDSSDYGLVESVHFFILHAICDSLSGAVYAR